MRYTHACSNTRYMPTSLEVWFHLQMANNSFSSLSSQSIAPQRSNSCNPVQHAGLACLPAHVLHAPYGRIVKYRRCCANKPLYCDGAAFQYVCISRAGPALAAIALFNEIRPPRGFPLE